ncbi:MAG: hypothetical protein AAFX04_11590 [Pseudomonadota bacterium]
MSAATPSDGPARATRPRKGRIILWIFLALLAVAIIGLLWNLGAIRSYTNVGSAYAARVVCSCRYVGGRELGDCEKDLEPGMEVVSLSDDNDVKRVTAYVPLLAEQQAEFRDGYGCVLLTEAEREAQKQ